MNIPIFDLTRYIDPLMDEWIGELKKIAKSGHLINGPQKVAFEDEFAKYLGVKHVLGVASGTDALAIAMRVLGTGKGDEVITHANTFMAAVEAILSVGATPVLVDMSKEDYGPDLADLESKITPRTKAVIVAHLMGLPADLRSLEKIIKKHNLFLIEDVAQAQGAECDGKKVGSFGKVNAFSFYPAKNFGALGDAGCIATNDDDLYERARVFANHGQIKKYEHVIYGWNSRLDEIQAVWLRLSLRDLDSRNQKRRQIYEKYRAGLGDLPIKFMPHPEDRAPVFHQAIIGVGKDRRDPLREHLLKRGIENGLYYPRPLHQQEAWKRAALPEGVFARAEEYAVSHLSLPIFPELTEKEVDYIVNSVKEFF